MVKFYIQERAYLENCTVSDLYDPDGVKIGYALEDVARPVGVKIAGKTCIPEGVYDVSITMSSKYQKEMIQLSNVGRLVDRDGVSFQGVRVHGGNNVDDTEGCPLIAEHFDGDETIWASLSNQVTADIIDYIEEGFRVKWIITRK